MLDRRKNNLDRDRAGLTHGDEIEAADRGISKEMNLMEETAQRVSTPASSSTTTKITPVDDARNVTVAAVNPQNHRNDIDVT